MSAIRRMFLEEPPVGTFTLGGAQCNHAKNVLRMRVGDLFVCNCGDGNDYTCEILSFGKSTLTARVKSVAKNVCDPCADVTLFQAVCRADRMEWIVQKGSELGLRAVVPFVSAFSQPNAVRLERLRTIAREATKQCGRSVPLEVSEPQTFENALHLLEKYDMIIFAYEGKRDGSLRALLQEADADRRIALVVGSEGGFSSDEADALESVGAHTVGLGKRILRAETAVVALTSAVLCLLGEWEAK